MEKARIAGIFAQSGPVARPTLKATFRGPLGYRVFSENARKGPCRASFVSLQVEETVLQVSFNLLARCCPFGVSFHCKPVLAFSFTLADGPGVGGVSSDLPGCSPSS